MKFALSAYLPERYRHNFDRENTSFIQYWKDLVKYIQDRPYYKLRDEDVLKGEMSSERTRRLKRIQNHVTA